MRRQPLALLLLLPSALAQGVLGVARAAGKPSDATVVGAAGGVEDAVLVGPDGEIWRRDGETWRRANRGGVAATLTHVHGTAANDAWAAGAGLTPYRWDGATWTAVPLDGGGDAVLASGPAVAVAGGRRIHLREKDKWRDLPLTGGKKTPRISDVWVGGARDAVVVDEDGGVRRLTGGKWTELVASERIERLLVGGAGAVYAIGVGGSIARVDAKALKPLTVETKLGEFRPRLAGGTGPKDLRFLGAAEINGKTLLVLARVDKTQVVYVDALPADQLAAGDAPVALLAAKDGAVLVITRQGVVLRRAAAGGWTTEHVDATPPADDAATHGKNPPARTATR